MSDLRRSPYWLFRRADQTAIVALVAVALAATVGWWIARGGHRGEQVEMDRAEPLSYRFEVDVNAADLPELIQVPGIGAALAERIIASREALGPFASIDDLRRVHGVGAKRLDQMRPYLRVRPGDRAMQR